MKFKDVPYGKFFIGDRELIKINAPLGYKCHAAEMDGTLLTIEDDVECDTCIKYELVEPGQEFYIDRKKYIKLKNGYMVDNIAYIEYGEHQYCQIEDNDIVKLC